MSLSLLDRFFFFGFSFFSDRMAFVALVLVTSESSRPVGCLHWGFGILCGLGDSGKGLVPGIPSTYLSSGKSEVYQCCGPGVPCTSVTSGREWVF